MIIVLSVLLRFPAADYPFDIFKLFFMLFACYRFAPSWCGHYFQVPAPTKGTRIK
jgi:hypothetical protein